MEVRLLVLLLLALLARLEHSPVFADNVVMVQTEDDSSAASTLFEDMTTTRSANNKKGTCPTTTPTTNHSQCRIWVAMSTLPGTGIGMFAGAEPIQKGEEIMPGAGDHIIPIVDLELFHHEGVLLEDIFFFWDEYTWTANSLGLGTALGGESTVKVASPGFGAVANCFMDFINVDEGNPMESVAQNLHRSKDPGAGAFTYYHSRMSKAKKDIKPGEELFVKYGNHWFLRRQEKLGPIPIKGDHDIAFKLFQRYKGKIVSWEKAKKNTEALKDMWDIFVLDSAWESRVFAALPPKEDYTKMEDIGLIKLKQNRMVRSVEWLEENGICADNFYMDTSTLKQAGHGAFASRFLAEGSPVLPIPLIHIPYRHILDMYALKRGKYGPEVDKTKGVVGKQLLLNYCLGHANSTMLLSPYGPMFVANHNQTLVNVRLQWALPERSNHHPEMLEKPVYYFYSENSAKLAMELVALKDIQPGEEIFLDYGEEWENAWQEHLRTWSPVPDAESYVPVKQFEEKTEQLKTELELLVEPYPKNVELKCFSSFLTNKRKWQKAIQNGQDLHHLRRGQTLPCNITGYKKDSNDRSLYTTSISGEDQLVDGMPREAFTFEDKPYAPDMFLTNAFRHDIRIPNDIFPDAWKNLP